MTWLDLPDDHPFGLENLPYGVFSTAGTSPRVGVRVGDWVLDAAAAANSAGAPIGRAWRSHNINAFLARGRAEWAAARAWLGSVLVDETHRHHVEPHLIPYADVTMHLPIEVADYVDFYASEHHASNVGKLFRPESPALPANWKHLPIGYHGRSSSVVVSGTDIIRPQGQRKAKDDAAPSFGPSRRLDIEAELGFVVGESTKLGRPVSVTAAADHLFGVVLLNDWSARDIQAWEYVPLGPFLGKSFATSISAWVVTMDALEAARVALPGQDPAPLPYLQGDERTVRGLDIHFEVEWNGSVVSRPEYRDMYWSPTQMLAHMTVNGAPLSNGDLFGSGTISGPRKETRGSFLELAWGGQEPVRLDDGSERTFLEDGDTIIVRAWAPGRHGARIGLGEVTGTVVGNG